ncbi:Athe_2463 domain-containing protein [Caldalkalibacillus salinus]|uniref:Athe_2463 domain-containing protein n=1 Tax=Caldalkalibacillus salinus TaxID=2803787 RepID=UPI0019228F89|nr:PKD domain-containing protein [Caldalkalibacillus salinus]
MIRFKTKLFFVFIVLTFTINLNSSNLGYSKSGCSFTETVTPEAKPCNAQGYPFNKKIWEDKQLVVYGQPRDVSGNQFKYATQPREGTIIEGSGYYRHNNRSGEWRYHGFDEQGQRYTNREFPDDDNTRTDLQRQWIFEPWDNNLSYEQSRRILFTGDRSSFYRNYIEHYVIPSVPNGISLTDGTPPSRDPMHYLYVYQTPDLIQPGAGIMWHKSPTTGKIWYKTFHMPKIKQGRTMTPVEAELEVLDEPPINIEHYKGQSTIPVEVRVNGYLLDEDYIGRDADTFAYYTREDIKEWTLEITRPSDGQKEVVRSVGNKGTATFTIDVPADQIDEAGAYIANASATVHFKDRRTNEASVSQTIIFGGEGFELLSLFNVRNEIRFTKRSEFDASAINYVDQSLGEIIRYDFGVTELSTDETISFSYDDNAVDDDAVQDDIYDFIKPYFTDEKVSIPHSLEFEVRQTITTDNDKRDTHVETITVTHFPADDVGGIDDFNHVYIEPDLRVPKYAYDVVGVQIRDHTDMTNVAERVCYIDDVQVNQNELFSGNYVFGIGEHGFHEVSCTYESTTGDVSFQSTWIYVIDTKPKVQFELSGPFKENRKMTIRNNTEIANFPMLWEAYPVTEYEWDVIAVEGAPLEFRTDTDMKKEFLSRTPGVYTIQLVGRNELGRESDPYIVEFPIAEDLEPAVVLHPFDSQIARGEEVRFMYDAESVDGDVVGDQRIEIFYDSNNDGEYDQLVNAFDPSDGFTEYRPPTHKLGRYQVVATVEEEFGEETLPELLDGTEKRVRVVKTAFEVDNFQPAASVYSDVPYVEPEIDVYVLLDQDLARSKNDHIVSNRISINNMLRDEGMNPVVEMWDMHTYIHSSDASATRSTGSRYPPQTIEYTEGQWSGTLSRDRVTNNPYTRDEGWYETQTVYKTFSRTCTNTRHKLPDGGYSGSDDECPSRKYVSSDGYVGHIPRVRTSGPKESNGGNTRTFTAYYEGTLSKEEEYWRSNPKTYNRYTGHYSGTVYQSVRQPYDNAFFRVKSDKYVVYVSDGGINDLSDLQTLMRENDASLILVGQQRIKNQVNYDHYIPHDKPIEDILQDVVQYIADNNVDIPHIYTLVDEPFALSFKHHDAEGDPITREESMYVHDYQHFDNDQGLAHFATDTYKRTAWREASEVSTFSRPGKYTVYHRVQDQPSSDPRFAHYRYFSNEAQLEVYAHRKPIALLELDWDYDDAREVYRTSWVDRSYDLDHQFSREDKGIVDTRMKLTRNNSETYTIIPEELQPGTYELEYVVQDPEYTWSEPYTMRFTLEEAPPIQLDAKARAKIDDRFSLRSIPASEDLLLHDVWTRYPYGVRLEVAMYQDGQRKTPTKTVKATSATGEQNGNDIHWHDITYPIPDDLPDGSYQLRLTAIGTTTGERTTKAFNVRVNTPIDLEIIDFPEELYSGQGERYDLKGKTTKYANQLQVTLHRGTSYQTQLSLNGSIQQWKQDWKRSYTVPRMADGTYTAVYRATTPNGNVETQTVRYDVTSNRPPVAGFYILPRTIYEGDTVRIRSRAYDPDDDPITYEYTWTKPDGSTQVLTDEHPTFRVRQVGTHTIRQVVTDTHGAQDTMNQSFTVHELTITGQVSHTEEWNETHDKLNNSPEQFYSGEKFKLQADVTDHTIQYVRVVFEGEQVDGQSLRIRTNLEATSDNAIWTGELYEQSMTKPATRLQNGPAKFTFTVRYRNGIVKQDEVYVNIIGSAYEVLDYHRTR